MTNEQLKRKAMSLVNTLYELAELTVDKRQSINDKADDIVVDFLSQATKETVEEEKERIWKSCPVITELKDDNGYLWVKIPEIEDCTSYQILPENVIHPHSKDEK